MRPEDAAQRAETGADMRIHDIAVLGAMAVASGLASPGVAAATITQTTYNAVIERVDCPFPVLRGDAASCFQATVPLHYADVAEDGSLPDGAPRITLAVSVLENFVEMENPNPIVLISGGPGQAASDMLASVTTALHLRRSRGIVLIDQRGTGASSPSLNCAEASPLELDENRLNDPEFLPESSLGDRLDACVQQWRADGVDFNAFDTRSAALDLLAIRRGFGIEQWNLHGTSYGARVVSDAMRVDPDGIRSAVLNSPQAIFAHFDQDFAESRLRLFSQLFEDCAGDSYCHENFGDLEAHMRKIHAHLADEGMEIFLRESGSGNLQRVNVDWEDVLNGLYSHMNFSFGAEPVARYISELSRVVDGRLSLNDDEVARIFQSTLSEDDDGMAIAMHLAVRCREDVPAFDAAVAASAEQQAPMFFAGAEGMGSYYDACEAMGINPVDPSFYELVASDIPTLVLTGDMDPLTPTSWAGRTAGALINGQLVAFRGMAHDIFSTSICAQAITANFIEAPFMPVDDTCARSYGPVFSPVQQ
jgi:pimeloyl-ACP methyl ester carboxylesterase